MRSRLVSVSVVAALAALAAGCSNSSDQGPTHWNGPPPSTARSHVALSVGSVAADGTTAAEATVTVRDADGLPISNAPITLSYDGAAVVTAVSPLTDADGMIRFLLTSTAPSTGGLSATLDSTPFGETPTLQFHDCEYSAFVNGACAPPPMVRLDPAVAASWGGVNPDSFAIGDLDGNGLADVAVADPDGHAIQVLVSLGDGRFAPRYRYDAGAPVYGVVVADVTGDAIQDVVTIVNAGQVGATFCVLPGIGDGTLGPAHSAPFSGYAFAAAAVDLDGDGDLDIVTREPSGVGVALNAGYGSFPTYTEFVDGNRGDAAGVIVADLDGGGILDVAVVFPVTSEVEVRLGMGDGTLGAPLRFPTGTAPWDLAVIDLDGDGTLDVVTADYGPGSSADPQTVSVLLGNGDGSFGAPGAFATGANPGSVAAGDLDGDGHADVVTADMNGGSLSILLGDGTGSLGAPTPYEAGRIPRRVAIARIDRDAIPDLVLLDGGSETVRGFLGGGGAAFAAARRAVPALMGDRPAVADVDRDGVPDLLTLPFVSGAMKLGLSLGKGDGTFSPPSLLSLPGDPGSGRALTSGDLNGDGRPDVVVLSTASNTATVVLGQANGTLTLGQTYAVGSGPAAAAIGDVNGDLKPDLIVANGAYDGGTVSVLLGSGTGAFSPQTQFAAGGYPRALSLGDLDGDGALDLLVASIFPRELRVLRGDGSGHFALDATTYATGASASTNVTSVATADLDGDGDLDAVSVDSKGNAIGVFFGAGDGTFAPRIPYRTGVTPQSLSLGDVNGDGHLDVVTADADSATVTLLRGRGDGTFQAGESFMARESASHVLAADVTGDSRADVIVQTNTQVQVMLGQGAGLDGWSPQVMGARPSALATADLDGDGVLDLVSVSHERSGLSVALGLGGGAFGPATTLSVAAYPSDVAVARVDDDPYADLVVAHVSIYDSTSLVGILLGNGDGTFRPEATYASGLSSEKLAVGDVTGDGKIDVVVSGQPAASLLRGNGDGSLQPPVGIATDPAVLPVPSPGSPYCVGVGLADLDGDGPLDVLATQVDAAGIDHRLDEIAILFGDGAGSFAPRVAHPGRVPYAPLVADLDGDGDLDVAATTNGNTFTVLSNDGSRAFSPAELRLPMGGITAALGDLDLDGDLDLVTAGFYGFGVHRNEGGLAFDSFTYVFPVPVSDLVVEDLDGDGRPDVTLLGQGVGAFPLFAREP